MKNCDIWHIWFRVCSTFYIDSCFGLLIMVNFSLDFSGLFRSEFSAWFFLRKFTWIALNLRLYFIYFPGSFFVCPGRIRIIQLLAAYNLPIIALFGILLLF